MQFQKPFSYVQLSHFSLKICLVKKLHTQLITKLTKLFPSLVSLPLSFVEVHDNLAECDQIWDELDEPTIFPKRHYTL